MTFKEVLGEAVFITPLVAFGIISVWMMSFFARMLWAAAPEFVIGAIVVGGVSFTIAVVITLINKSLK